MTTWEGSVYCCGNGGTVAQVSALSGGEVLLAGWTTDKGGSTHIVAQGSGSVVDLPALTNLTSDQGGNSSALQATQGGQIESPNLKSLSDVSLTIDGTGTQDTAQIASFAGGTLSVSGGSPSFAGLSSIDGSSVYVSSGVSLTLPAVTEYTGGSGYSTTLQASGANSVLSLPDVTTWEGSVYCCGNGGTVAQVSAVSGGEVSLAGLTTDTGGSTHILAQGSGSVVDLPALINLTSDQGGNSSALQATQGGQIESPNLTSLSDVSLTIDGTGTQDTAQIASFAGGTLSVSGGSPSFAGLSSIDGSGVYVSSGVSLTLPAVTEYTGGSGYSTTLQASGANSVLSLPDVTTWEGSVYCCGNGGTVAQVSAVSGGEVSLAGWTTDKGGATYVVAQGTSSVVDLPALTNLTSDQGRNTSELEVTQGGQIESPSLASIYDTTVTLNGGSADFPDLAAIDGSDVYVSGGVSLTLPAVTEYTGGSGYSTTLQASGADSVLSLPDVTTWEGSVYCCGNGGTVAQVERRVGRRGFAGRSNHRYGGEHPYPGPGERQRRRPASVDQLDLEPGRQ